MDILTLGDLAITNHNHQTVLSFRVPPDTRHIDFVSAESFRLTGYDRYDNTSGDTGGFEG
jgi:hypothetical protein